MAQIKPLHVQQIVNGRGDGTRQEIAAHGHSGQVSELRTQRCRKGALEMIVIQLEANQRRKILQALRNGACDIEPSYTK